MACLFVEHCGRFLLRSPDSHLRAKALLVRREGRPRLTSVSAFCHFALSALSRFLVHCVSLWLSPLSPPPSLPHAPPSSLPPSLFHLPPSLALTLISLPPPSQEIMVRKKRVQHLDGRQKSLIENALYCANPPETPRIVQEPRPPMLEYVRKLLYKDLSKNNTEKVCTCVCVCVCARAACMHACVCACMRACVHVFNP